MPAPTSVIVISEDEVIAGSSPNLNCTVELSSAVDIPITLYTVWTGPAFTSVFSTGVVMENLTVYTMTAIVDAARNGSYTCEVNVSSTSEFINSSEAMAGSTVIIVGMHYSLSSLYKIILIIIMILLF